MKLFPFVADIVLRTRCIACVSIVKIELNLVRMQIFVRFPVAAAAPTPISLLEPSVYM